MEPTRFDAFSRALGATRTRREGTRLLAAVAAGGAVAALPELASAARCSKTVLCPPCQRCKKKKCKPDKGQDANLCATCTACDHGACTNTRIMNLSACGNNAACWDGSCSSSCPAISAPDGACYWLDCTDFASCCWVLANVVAGDLDEAECVAEDHCASGGACYRWASSADDPI